MTFPWAYDGTVATPRHQRRVPPKEVDHPPLTPFEGRLSDGEDYEALEFAGLDLAGASAVGASFLGCRIERCSLDAIRLDRARFGEGLLRDLKAASINARDSAWRDTVLADARFGALLASGSTWDLVRLRNIKANLLDLRGRAADGRRARGLHDRRAGPGRHGAAIGALRGLCDRRPLTRGLPPGRCGSHRRTTRRRAWDRRSARGTVAPGQLLDLAPLLAAHLGIRVRE